MSNFFTYTHAVLFRELMSLYKEFSYKDLCYLADIYPGKRMLERVCKEINEQLETMKESEQ